MTENARKVLEQIIRDTSRAAVVLETEVCATDIYDSKIGGKPYLPKDAEYPCSTRAGMEGTPLVLLCQLNLDRFPGYRDMPTAGMLQIFIAADGNYGVSADHVTQDNFRVVYYESINYDKNSLREPPEFSYDPAAVPFREEMRLHFRETTRTINIDSDDLDDAYEKALQETGIQLSNLEYLEMMNELAPMGEYSGWCENVTFLQKNARPEAYPELLIQIDSDCTENETILWGDKGVSHFFIAADKLRVRDFTEVYYHWECG